MNPSLGDIIWIFLLVLLVVYWVDAMAAKEIARAAGKRLCKQSGVLILDDTVALHRLRLRRDAHGHMRFWRLYDFEFTSDGEYRHRGRIELLGRQLLQAELGVYRIN